MGEPILQMIKEGTEAIQTLNSAGGAVITLGTTIVTLYKQGKSLFTFLFSAKHEKFQNGSASVAPLTNPITEMNPKKDVVIVVDVSRRILNNVAVYLDKKKIDADVFLVTNDFLYSAEVKFQDVKKPREWTEMVEEFNKTINQIKRDYGNSRIHFFLSVPLPLAFGMGCVWGTVDNAFVYQWDGKTYYPVLKINRTLRSNHKVAKKL